MLFKKMLRDMKLNLSQFISIFIMSILGVLVFTGINGEWYGMQKQTNKYYQRTNFANIWISGNNMTKQQADEVSKLDNITNVERRLTFDGTVNIADNPTIRLNFVEKNEISKSVLIKGESFHESEDGLWLESAFAKKRNLSVGDKITINAMDMELTRTIKGLIMNPEYAYVVKDESELIPDHKMFGFAFMSYKAFPNPEFIQYNQILIKTNSTPKYREVEKQIEEKLNGNYSVISNREMHPSYAMLNNEIIQNKAMGGIFPVVFLLIAVLTMLTTMTRITKNQRTQIGIFKALGFSRSKILYHYVSYGLWIGALGSITGLILGPLTLPPILFNMQKSIYSLPQWKADLSPINTFIVIISILSCVATSYYACMNELRGVPASTLRPKSPKLSHHTRIEKSKFWHKLGFSIQWNIRDISRNKIRSIMAIVGVMGCMMLLMCALGLQDTFNNINKWMYERINTYETKLKLEYTISDEDINAIKSKFNTQLVQEAGIEIKVGDKKKSGQLSIVGDGNYINYQDKFEKKMNLPTDGIAITYKMADIFNIKVNDKIKWHIYGDETWTESTIKAIYRTPMGQGISMTDKVYTNMGNDFKPTSALCGEKITQSENFNGVKSIHPKSQFVKSFNLKIDSLKVFIYIMIFVAVFLGVIVLYNLGILSFTERLRELATLKVLGFSSSKIRNLLQMQNIWLTVIGIIFGTLSGNYLILFILSTMNDTIDMVEKISLQSYIICIGGTFLLSIFVNSILSKKIKTIDMVSSLKAIE